MFADFLCKEVTISPSQTKHAKSEGEISNCNIEQELDIESGLQDIHSSQKVILNISINKNSILFRFFTERKGQFLDFSVF